MSLSGPQRRQAISLYRRLLRTGQSTFAGDAQVINAWHDKVRGAFSDSSQFAQAEAGAVEAKLQEWEDVITILKKNIVQGRRSEEGAYKLRITDETELGSNESIKQGRQKQLDALAASKGPSCRSGGSSIPQRSFSTLSMGSAWQRPASPACSRAFSTSSICAGRPLPPPVPHFPSTTILSDGSSVQLHTTSPRHVVKLTRDITNHPLWNPALERKGGVGDGSEEEASRLGRFRRRFAEEAAGKAGQAGQGQGAVRFGEEDFGWMSVGGRQARAGTPISKAKAKAKGKK